MNVLVTGSSGFLGSALLRFLEAHECNVTGLDSKAADLRDPRSLDRFDLSYDLIFHLAAWTQAGDFCLRHPGEQWIINQQINTNVLAWWSARQPQAKIMLMGTSCAYAPSSALKEPEYMAGEPIESLYTYALTKRMLYQGARSLSTQYGLRYLYLVPSTLYGPDYHTDGRQMHFIFDLIRKIIRGKEFGEPVVLWGDGDQRREVVFVSDFISALWHLVGTRDNEIFNIGAGEEYSIRQFAEMICSIVGFSVANIQYDTSRYVGARSKCLNIDKLKSAWPDYTPRPLLEGLQKTIEWFYSEPAALPAVDL